jgi:hypothetical protein
MAASIAHGSMQSCQLPSARCNTNAASAASAGPRLTPIAPPAPVKSWRRLFVPRFSSGGSGSRALASAKANTTPAAAQGAEPPMQASRIDSMPSSNSA